MYAPRGVRAFPMLAAMDIDFPVTVTSHGDARIFITEPPKDWRSLGEVPVHTEILTLAAPYIALRAFAPNPSA